MLGAKGPREHKPISPFVARASQKGGETPRIVSKKRFDKGPVRRHTWALKAVSGAARWLNEDFRAKGDGGEMGYQRIGQHKPTGSLYFARYVGSRPQYRGKLALVAEGPGKSLVVQFDDRNTKFGYGWHRFRRSDWEIVSSRYRNINWLELM